MSEVLDDAYRRAAEAIAGAEALVIAAGAGMGVDSGLPDFRGREGFWRAYPRYGDLGLDFMALATPRTFREEPELAWGFYGHRLSLYRRARPHTGFDALRVWAARMPLGAFVFTSNVDGHFQRAGFYTDRIVEIHGAIDRLQCLGDCGFGVFPMGPEEVVVDEATMRATGPLPQCPSCGALARPNIKMFADRGWDYTITGGQEARLNSWLSELAGRRLAVVECGAGTAIPTVRLASEDLCDVLDATLVRVNPHEADVPGGQIALPVGAMEGLLEIRRLIDAVGAR